MAAVDDRRPHEEAAFSWSRLLLESSSVGVVLSHPTPCRMHSVGTTSRYRAVCLAPMPLWQIPDWVDGQCNKGHRFNVLFSRSHAWGIVLMESYRAYPMREELTQG